MKQMNCYQKDLTSKSLSNYYVVQGIQILNVWFYVTNFVQNKLKAVTIIYFKCKYLEQFIVVG